MLETSETNKLHQQMQKKKRGFQWHFLSPRLERLIVVFGDGKIVRNDLIARVHILFLYFGYLIASSPFRL